MTMTSSHQADLLDVFERVLDRAADALADGGGALHGCAAPICMCVCVWGGGLWVCGCVGAVQGGLLREGEVACALCVVGQRPFLA